MSSDPWFVFAVACSLTAYASYLIGLRRDLVQPNRASWLIWSAATALEAITYAAVNPGAPQAWVFGLSAIACLLVTIGIWRRSAWERPTPAEAICIAASAAALLLWLGFREAFWAHMLVVAAVPIGFWPTWVSLWADRRRELSPAWGLWTLGDLATLIVAGRHGGSGVGEYAYIGMELVCHASVWLAIGLATINPWRSFAAARRDFIIGDTHLGRAVFAGRAFAADEPLMRFTGRRLRADRVPAHAHGSADRFVQVAPDRVMGPSGRFDDFVNHSCEPNAGLRFAGDRITLVALRPIAAGEEISWDYSTTLMGSDWHMICQCQAASCRRVIGDFATLPPARQAWFRARNLVAPYLRDDPLPNRRDRAA